MKKLYLVTEEKLQQLVEQRLTEQTQKANKNHERELLMKQADIRSLQAQINPHFLYNALECIRAQAIIDGADDIATVTQALSLFFRYNISNKGDLISLGEEFENVQNYMVIQQYRYKDRLSLEVVCDYNDREIIDTLLPKLVLQPLVENSIIHGFSNMTNNAKITISAKKVSEHMSIQVKDNGKGMDTIELHALRNRLQNHDSGVAGTDNPKLNGIALHNVNRRIELLYGSNYSLNITSCKGEGTEVELFIPVQNPTANAHEK